ncbi:MAG: RNA polymerase factor sigma-54 [Chlamydiae bacterium]|nr:RNA polymerase factor sigma-54 [Chlamydiota bacterium]
MHNNDINLQFKQTQQLLLSLSMQKALFVLQLPVLELKDWLEEELSLNPVLERKKEENDQAIDGSYIERKSSSSHRVRQETSELYEGEGIIERPCSLFIHLMNQAKLVFSSKEELWIAEQIIGNLDDRGYLLEIPDELDSIVTLQKIDEVIAEIRLMDPPGICASGPRDSLLLQLIALGKDRTLCYSVIENHYEELLQQRFNFLEKKYRIPAAILQEQLKKELSFLNPYPGLKFQISESQPIVPDVLVEKQEDKWQIHINAGPLPRFEVTTEYVHTDLSDADKKYFAKHYSSARFIIRSVKKRNETILAIVKYILKKQSPFFDCDKNELIPMSIAEIAEELSLNESTIARAVSHKYIACPQGVLLLKSFFSTSLSKDSVDVSSYNAKQLLQKIIQEENKKSPLSDMALVKKLKEVGCSCARRTVTKYRKALRIAPASKRKLS